VRTSLVLPWLELASANGTVEDVAGAISECGDCDCNVIASGNIQVPSGRLGYEDTADPDGKPTAQNPSSSLTGFTAGLAACAPTVLQALLPVLAALWARSGLKFAGLQDRICVPAELGTDCRVAISELQQPGAQLRVSTGAPGQ